MALKKGTESSVPQFPHLKTRTLFSYPTARASDRSSPPAHWTEGRWDVNGHPAPGWLIKKFIHKCLKLHKLFKKNQQSKQFEFPLFLPVTWSPFCVTPSPAPSWSFRSQLSPPQGSPLFFTSHCTPSTVRPALLRGFPASPTN